MGYVITVKDQFNQMVRVETSPTSAGAQALAAMYRGQGLRVVVTTSTNGSTTY